MWMKCCISSHLVTLILLLNIGYYCLKDEKSRHNLHIIKYLVINDLTDSYAYGYTLNRINLLIRGRTDILVCFLVQTGMSVLPFYNSQVYESDMYTLNVIDM